MNNFGIDVFLYEGVVLMFIGLTIYNLEYDNPITSLHKPLLNSEEQEVCSHDVIVPF